MHIQAGHAYDSLTGQKVRERVLSLLKAHVESAEEVATEEELPANCERLGELLDMHMVRHLKSILSSASDQ